jgi:uncharacterized phage protein gp47/JayE
MSFNIPTPQELRDQNYNELETEIEGSNPRLQNSFLNGIAKMTSLAIHGVYIYLKYLFKQIFVTTADSEFLDLHGSPLGIDRLEATASTGNVTATGNDSVSVPQGTLLQRSDGVQYRVTTGGITASGTVTVPVEAVSFGLTTDALEGDSLSFVSPIAGLDSSALVASGGLTGGADEESDDDYKARILVRKRQPPQGGAEYDYTTWAKEVASVTRAWATGLEDGLGSVRVRFMMDDKYADGIPLAGDVTTVQDYIDATTRKPVTADVLVSAPVAEPVDIDITLSPNTPTVQASVTAELEDLFFRDSEPSGTILISKIREAVSRASGETDNTVTDPVANVTATSTGNILTVGTITFS